MAYPTKLSTTQNASYIFYFANMYVRYWEKSHQHIEAEAKLPLFSRRQFEIDFVTENAWISIELSLNFIHRVPIDNILALV